MRIEDMATPGSMQTSQSLSKTSRIQAQITRQRRLKSEDPVWNKMTRSQLSQARRIIFARQIQKLAKDDNPVFLPIVRQTNDAP